MFEDFDGSPRPRSRSPWDPFLPSPSDGEASAASTPGSYPQHLSSGIPKLVPEVEEGNIEYKLKLTNISALRFARLVTQLKWRLLEGHGQAYYELGVADSGALIGLARADMEASLETLECMAGEIGASVIVVKEIEVPAAVTRAADVGGLVQGDGWAGKMRKRGAGAEDDPLASATDTEELDLEADDSPWSTPNLNTPIEQLASAARTLHSSDRLALSHPARPTTQSSPAIAPVLDDDLALFSMEPEPEFDLDGPEDIPLLAVDPAVEFLQAAVTSLVLDISSVYKPRPFRKRGELRTVPQPFAGLSQGKLRKLKGREKKENVSPKPTALVPAIAAEPVPSETKAAKRRAARDKRREDKRRAFLTSTSTSAIVDSGSGVVTLQDPVNAVTVTEEPVDDLNLLHITAPDAEASPFEDVVSVAAVVVGAEADGDAEVLQEVVSMAAERLEPRLIVEALVVRKSSIEEAFLDFGGVSLV